jgi:flagellar biosynthesis/type III secretory pathway chaperone
MLTTAHIDGYKEILRSRLQAIRSLTEVLVSSQSALLSRDAGALRQLTAQQQTLCGEIEFLDTEMRAVQKGPEPVSEDVEYSEVKQEMVSAEGRLVKAYKVHAALLRRARRSVNVMINVAKSESNAYCSPSSYQSLQLGEE